MARDKRRAELRENLVAQIKSLENTFGENSATPQLIEARVSLWALEYADNPTPENLRRLQQVVVEPSDTAEEADVPAVLTHPTDTGATTIDPTVQRIKTIGWDGHTHLFKEDSVCDLNPESTRWDAANRQIRLTAARNSFEDFFVAVEAAQDVAEDFTVSLGALTGPGGATIGNTSTDPANKRDRPLKTMRPAWVKCRGVSWFAADYILQGTPLGPGYRESHRFGPWRSTDGTRDATSRPALGKHLPSMWMDTAWTEVGATQTVDSTGLDMTFCEIWVRPGLPIGEYTGEVTVTSLLDGAEQKLPIVMDVTSVTLGEQNADPYLLYVNSDQISDRVNGRDAHNAMVTGDTAYNLREQMVDLAAIACRGYRMTPIFHDNESGAGPVSVPQTRLEARLLGSLYDGSGYLGPAVNQQLQAMTLGVYGRWRGWPGIDRDSATKPTAMDALLDQFDAWRTSTGFAGDVFAYLADEPRTIEELLEIEKWAQWFAGRGYFQMTTPGSSHGTAANFEDMIANAPSVRAFAVNAPIMPKDTPDHLVTYRQGDADKKFGIYNNQGPMAYSHQLDDRLDGHIINGLGQKKLGGFDFTFFWSGWETINNEGYGHFTGLAENSPGNFYDEDGNHVYKVVGGRGRMNPWKTHHSIGENRIPDSRRATHGHCGNLYSEGDGNLWFCGLDAYFDDAPQVADMFPTTRAIMIRRRRQYEQAIDQAAANNPTGTKAFLDGIVLDGTFCYEVGVHGDGTASEDRSYNQVDRLLDAIDSDAVGAGYKTVLQMAA